MSPKAKPLPIPAEEPDGHQPPAVFLQEQHMGPVAAQDQRSAAEILAERLAETGSGSDSPAFVP